MDNDQLLPLLGGLLVGGPLAAGAVYARMSSRAKREAQRHLQAEQALQLAGQQLTQARKQIEQLQRENHELRLAVRPAPRPAPPPEAPVDPAEAARLYAESKLQPQPAKPKPEAFKDTVVLRRTE
ncbi:hypothetical protein [Roseateles sp. LYH14W]|uniref:DUF1043 family protein n=1 Tax=Pelomonas parva TaxID=3299032 RepID=A0ABW7F0L5_9BURK